MIRSIRSIRSPLYSVASPTLLHIFLALALISLPANTGAQAVSPDQAPDDRPDECFGFTFGRWTPALEWAAAGHTADSAGRGEMVGREPAVSPASTGHSTLLLYPSWWRAGVLVRLPAALSARDTLDGVAVALVANGRSNPTSKVRAWRIPCRR